MKTLLLLSTTTLLCADKQHMRETFPEIWAKLEKMNYTFYIEKEQLPSDFLLENRSQIVYTTLPDKDGSLWHAQNLHQKVL